MLREIPMKNLHLDMGMGEYEYHQDKRDRQLYLFSEIKVAEDETDGEFPSRTSQLVYDIMDFNREDKGIPREERKPIRLYINSPGGAVHEGFALVSAIELSETPVWTINLGEWCSMAFLIGITGHRRFSLPRMMFLMHDGTNFAWDSGNKVQDKMEFDKRFSDEVIKAHVLKHSNMKDLDYQALSRVEYYMLPEDALERGFIDEIVEDINEIL